ncbi:MAG: hypothetical protein GKR96_05250 [Gammaproteobacteria bacterium]|nr:hypothetical protein [Gammaproteobacteria bacterium]
MKILLKKWLWKVELILIALACQISVVGAAEVAGEGIEQIVGTRVIDVQGNRIQLGMDENVLKAVVIVFLNPTCSPLVMDRSTNDVRSLNEISAHVHKLGMKFYGVVSDINTSWAEVKEYVDSQGLGFPVILDGDGNLAHLLNPVTTSEVFVLSKHSELLRHGGLSGISEIVTAVSKGEFSQERQSISKDCPLRRPDVTEQSLNYNQHIAGLIQGNCVECHRKNGVAPFHLENYIQARNFAHVIAHVTRERIMPPWKADSDSGHYLNERLLTQYQIDLIQNWVKGGAKEGDAAAAIPAPELDVSGWRLGQPDIVITMPEAFDIPSSGPDIYRYFVVNDAIPDDLQIAMIDFKPGDPSVVHHSNFFVDYGKKARKMDEKDPKPGFSVFGTGGFFSYWDEDSTAAGLGAWAPSGNPVRYADGIGIKLPGGADFVFEVHYHPTGKKTRDLSQLGIYLSEKPIKRAVSSLFVGTSQIDIPAGDANYRRQFWIELPANIELVDIAPHMHYLGTRAEVDALLPSGKTVSLLKADWDFRWQGAYYYREPLHLPKGTRISAMMRYDNSADNPYNPYSPPTRATWGWGTDQEMGEIYLTVLSESDDDLKKLQDAAQQSWYRSSAP